jgi:hypothetical protein
MPCSFRHPNVVCGAVGRVVQKSYGDLGSGGKSCVKKSLFWGFWRFQNPPERPKKVKKVPKNGSTLNTLGRFLARASIFSQVSQACFDGGFWSLLRGRGRFNDRLALLCSAFGLPLE